MTRVKTTNVSGGEYAKVADRLLEFRKDNPRSSITTKHEFTPSGGAVFTTYILKDKRDEYSADATGSAAYTAQQMRAAKAFEKLETISVGRALSLLGYLNNGEIASSEEMEEFEQFRAEKHSQEVNAAIEQFMAAKTIDELKAIFASLPPAVMRDKVVQTAKDKRKGELA